MYRQSISRKNPGCIVILLDRSDSMKRPWAGADGLTLAEGAARAINKILLDLCIRSVKQHGVPPMHYFDVGVFGYGRSASADEERVEPAFGGDLAGRPLVSVTDLALAPLRLQEVPRDDGGPPARMPIWIEPLHGHRTPMCEAIAVAGGHIHGWIAEHPDSYPPIVVNITDGIVTDSPFSDLSIETWAQRLTALATNDGPTLLLNAFLAPEEQTPALYPATDRGLPEPGPLLWSMSSPLPATMVASARAEGFAVDDGARGLVFNANMATLVRFLEMGTRQSVDDH